MSEIEIWIGLVAVILNFLVNFIGLARKIIKKDIRSECCEFDRDRLTESGGHKITHWKLCGCLGKAP